MDVRTMRARRMPGVARWAAVALACTAWRCAHMEPPSGGPVDTRPPSVVAVYPSPGARNVPANAPVVLQFSEWIDRNVARNQAFVSPPLRGRLRVIADGDKLQVQPSEVSGGWRARTTYQVTVLPTLQDLHGVKAGKPFVLRFSTGPALDSAGFSGRASSSAPKGALMAALYHAGDRSSVEPLAVRATGFQAAKTPEPWSELPAHLAVADSSGTFRFETVAPGTYALFAFEDANGNFAYDYGFENAATGPLAVVVDSTPTGAAVDPQYLRTVPADTLPLRIASATFVADSVRPVDSLGGARDTSAPSETLKSGPVSGKIKLEFTRAPHPLRAAEAARYRLLPDSGAALPAKSVSWSPLDEAWMLDAGPLARGRVYRVETRSAPDFPGRVTGTGTPDTSLVFSVGAERDTTEWRIAFVRAAPTTLLPAVSSLAAPGPEFGFASSRPLTPARWKTLSERLEVRIDSAAVPRTLSLVNNFAFSLKFSRPPAAGKRLELRWRPLPGDTVFRAMTAVQIADSLGFGAVRLSPTVRDAGWVFRLEAADNTAVAVPAASVPPGVYRLFGFRDADGDGVWNPGALKPWTPQEPQARLLDSVVVKAGAVTDLTPLLESRGR